MLRNLGIMAAVLYAGHKAVQYFNKTPEVKPEIPMLLDLKALNETPLLLGKFLLKYMGREHTSTLACVCKIWRDLLDTPHFYEEMWKKHKHEVFGEHEWKLYYGDPGEVPPIPLRLVKLFCRIPSSLILKPAAVTRVEGNLPEPLNLQSIAEWSNEPLLGGHPVNYDPNTYGMALEKIEEPLNTRWILLSHQQVSTKKIWRKFNQKWKAYDLGKGEVAKTFAVILWLFTEKVRTGENHIVPHPQTGQINRIRTAEVIRFEKEHFFASGYEVSKIKRKISVLSTPAGILISPDVDESDKDHTAFLVEWNEQEAQKPFRIVKMQSFDLPFNF